MVNGKNLIDKQILIDYINEYINLCQQEDDLENACYIVAMQDVLSFLEKIHS